MKLLDAESHAARASTKRSLRQRCFALALVVSICINIFFYTFVIPADQTATADLFADETTRRNSNARSRVDTTNQSRFDVFAKESAAATSDIINAQMDRTPKPPSVHIPKKLLISPNDVVVKKGWDVAPFFVEKHKLIFLTIPKNACTVFKQLFRRMMGYPDWYVANSSLPHNPDFNGLVDLSIYQHNLSYVQHLLTSPEYTKVVFVRDPIERFVSAYLDKVVHSPWHYSWFCCNNSTLQEKHITEEQCIAEGQTPQGFLRSIRTCSEVHWDPQYNRLPKRIWDLVDEWFVGHVENGYQDMRRLLEKLELWDDYGASGWGKYGNMSIFESNLSPHSTGAKSQIDQYVTPALRQELYVFYSLDYDHKIFGFEKDT